MGKALIPSPTWISRIGLLMALAGGVAHGADRPVIGVSPGGLTPDRIEVHVGEVVRWRAERGVTIRLHFDPHPDGHEVIERAEEIRAVFRLPGEHGYVASVIADGHRHVRGVVVVRASDQPTPPLLICGPMSPDRLCVEP